MKGGHMEEISQVIFRQLSGRTYSNFHELESRLLQEFNRHVGDIPPSYSYRQLIELGQTRGWVTRAEGQFRVELD